MENISVNKLFKEYKNSGGTMNFKDFVDKHNRKKNAIGDSEISNVFKHSMGEMFGEVPVQEAKVVSFKNAIGDTSTSTASVPDSNLTFGINNYVIIGAVVIIAGSIALNYYLKHKK